MRLCASCGSPLSIIDIAISQRIQVIAKAKNIRLANTIESKSESTGRGEGLQLKSPSLRSIWG